MVVEHTTYKNVKKSTAAYASQILPSRFRLMVPYENFHMNETISVMRYVTIIHRSGGG